jgi:glycosyltransferase involved in cell wall biosynthesis
MKTHQMPKVLIVGNFSYSRAQGAHPCLGYAYALRDAGFSIEFLGGLMDETGIRPDFQQFPCHFSPDRCLLKGWRAAFRNLSAYQHHLLKWLEQVPAAQYSAVIADPGCGATVMFLLKLRRLCLAKSWKLALAIMEWQRYWRYGSSRARDSLLCAIDTEIQIRFVNKRFRNIIAVSSYLERYYRKSGCNVIRVPPLIDARAEKWHCQSIMPPPKQDLTLLFSGAWVRDRLDLVIEAVQHLRRDGRNIVLEFLGPQAKDLGRNPKLQKLISQGPPDALKFHGWVPSERALPIAASADFGITLRDRARWSDACFPCKVAEFQALGVPLLCNLTSDLDQVLKNGDNALIVPRVSVAALIHAIQRALALTPPQRERMRRCSLQCADAYFDYRRYIGPLSEFVNNGCQRTPIHAHNVCY